MSALIQVESNANPYAIGVVGGRLIRQPINHEEAVATAGQLEQDGWNFSVGLGQINRSHLTRCKVSYHQAFQACTNLSLSSKILQECYLRAQKTMFDPQQALRAALSCYYSGNFQRGFKSEGLDKPSYVQKIVASSHQITTAIPVVPSIQTNSNSRNNNINSKNLDTNDKAVEQPIDHAPVLLPFSQNKQQAVVQPYPLTTDTKQEKIPKKQPDKVLIF